MTLEKQTVSFPFNQGLGNKSDPKSALLPKLAILDNARRTKEGEICKRYGHSALGINITATTPTTATIEDASALASYNDELLIFAKQTLYSYNESANISADKGGCISASIELNEIVRNTNEQQIADVAVNNNTALILAEDTVRNGITASMFDTQGKSLSLVDYLVAAGGTRPRTVSFGSRLYGFYYDGSGNVKAFYFNALDPASISSVVTVSSSINTTNPHYDVIVHDTYILLAINVQSASEIQLIKLDANLGVVASTTISEAATNLITMVRGASSKTFVLWHNASGVRCAIRNVDLTSAVSAFTVENIASVVNCTAYALPNGSGIRTFYQISAAATYNHYIKQNTITNAGTAGTPSVFLRSVGLASKAWAYSPDTTDRGFVAIVHDSIEQSTVFIARNDGLIVAKAQAGMAAGHSARNGFVSSVHNLSTDKFSLAVVSKRNIGVENEMFFTRKGVSLLTIDFENFANFSTAQLAGNCLVAGGVVQTYDGQNIVEHGFYLYPENISLSQGPGGSITHGGIYNYVVVYEWTDNKGQVHRSAPSTPLEITMSGTHDLVTLTVPTLRLTQKYGEATGNKRSRVNIVVYRTENLGSVYYQVSSSSSPSYNDTTVDTVTITDGLADTSIISRAPLYLTGGILENVGPPSASLIVSYRNRIMLGGTEDDTVWASKLVRPNRPVEFNDAFVIKADPVGGKLKALAVLDDKLVLLKEDSLYFVIGDGPDDTGGGGVFTPPEMVISDVGCVDAKSVVTTPLGLMFKSRKGYYLLNRELQTKYVGADIEDYNSYDVTSAVLVKDQNEVRFTTDGGPTLVYNYFYDQWMTWSSFTADDAVAWKNTYVAIMKRTGSTSLVVKQDPDLFMDVNQFYKLKIGLVWASFAQMQGFQRIWRAVFLGEYKSPHTLKLSVAYNFSPVVSDEYYWTPQSALNITTFGDGAYYGSDEVFGGAAANAAYQIRTHLVQQKSQSVKFILEDINPSESGESFCLSVAAFEVGLKKGIVKLQAGQSQ